ncbi:MAG: TonB family protein [Rhodocyclaceae bacterium]|nr:TonB family protein [Rhodocyclaceae bacterium]
MASGQTTERGVDAAGLAIVLALHTAVLWGLWSHRLIPTPDEAVTLFVNFIAPPAPRVEDPPKPPPPKPRPVEKPQPRQLVAATPVVAPTEYAAPPPPPAPAIEAPPAPAPKPVGPVTLGSELSVACPERTPPNYPSISRRLSEEGTVTLRVELDEQGHVAAARVATGSGHPRLDDAALAAVRTWRCTPASRNGQPVRAVALQPFKFILQGN